jgi:hypothetical protein
MFAKFLREVNCLARIRQWRGALAPSVGILRFRLVVLPMHGMVLLLRQRGGGDGEAKRDRSGE